MHPEFAKPRQAAAAAAAAADEAPLPLSGLSQQSYIPLGHDVVGEGYLVASGLPTVTSSSVAGDQTMRQARSRDVYARTCSARDRDSYRLPPFTDLQRDMYNRSWKVVGRFRWRRKQSMPVLEARASLYAVKHKLRSVSNFGKKHLILSDSMSAVCGFAKGRSSSFQMRRVNQQVAALALVSNSVFWVRWLPSEANPADGPSRGSWSASVPRAPQPCHAAAEASADRSFTYSEEIKDPVSEPAFVVGGHLWPCLGKSAKGVPSSVPAVVVDESWAVSFAAGDTDE